MHVSTTIRLAPSEYFLSNDIHLSEGAIEDALTNTDSVSYATFQCLVNSSDGRYAYFGCFNIPQISNHAAVSDISILIKYRHDAYSSARRNIMPYLRSGTRMTAIGNGIQDTGGGIVLAEVPLTDMSFEYLSDVADSLYIGLDLGVVAGYTGNLHYIYGVELDITYDVPINKVVVNKNGTPETLIDLTADTVTPETLLSGYTAHDAGGAVITGTAEIGGLPSLQAKTATPTTSQQTILPDSGYDGLSSVTVNPIPSNYGLITWDGSSLMVS